MIVANAFETRGDHQKNWRPQPVLNRDLLAMGGAEELVRRDDPAVRVLDEAQRRASLEAFLKTRPSGPVWIFAYGSLIWNPAMKTAEARVARIDGLHRSFCLSMTVGRGTPDMPGLALGLDEGGSCLGMAYRIADDDLATELPILWGREMLLGGYSPQWVEVRDRNGTVFGHAIAFVVDRQDRLYAGKLASTQVASRLASAAGSWGTAADYLFRTRDALRMHKIPDAALEGLSLLVEVFQSDDDLADAA